MKICELLIWTWETEIIMKHDMIWRIMQIEGSVILIIRQGWTTSSSGKIRILQRYIVLFTSTLYSSNSSCHQPSSRSFAILATFFFFFAKHENFYFIFSSSTKTAGLTQPCPQRFSITLVFFWWYPALLTLFHWISQTSLKFDQWLELEKYFEWIIIKV